VTDGGGGRGESPPDEGCRSGDTGHHQVWNEVPLGMSSSVQRSRHVFCAIALYVSASVRLLRGERHSCCEFTTANIGEGLGGVKTPFLEIQIVSSVVLSSL
jgi:hypothetical protein